MREQAEAEEINKNLIRDFGYFEGGLLPVFRLLYVTKEVTEVRSGEFNEFHGDIFIRKTIGTERVEKYNYLDNIWLLERQFGYNEECVKAGDGYECIFAFQHPKSGNYLPLRYDVCKIYALGSLVAVPKKNGRMLAGEEEAHREVVYRKRLDAIEQMTSWTGHLFGHGEAIALNGKSDFLPASPNLRSKE